MSDQGIRSPDDASKRLPLIEPKDAFKFVLDTRNFEITNFWQRSNYFLVLNTGLAVGFFNLKDTTYAPFVALIGILCSFLWYRVTLGSKFWQVHWEKKLSDIERKYAAAELLDPELKLFCQSTTEVRKEVEAALTSEPHSFLAKGVDAQIAKKPSVTLAMISLSLLFVAAWAALFLANIAQ